MRRRGNTKFLCVKTGGQFLNHLAKWEGEVIKRRKAEERKKIVN